MKKDGVLDNGGEVDPDSDIPVNADINSQMKIDVTIDRNAQVRVFHNKAFPGLLKWVEYDADDGSLVFITEGGRLNNFSIALTKEMKKYLPQARHVEAFFIQDGTARDYTKVEMITRTTLH